MRVSAKAKELALTSAYFCESGLFKGLRSIQIRKNPPGLKLASWLWRRPLAPARPAPNGNKFRPRENLYRWLLFLSRQFAIDRRFLTSYRAFRHGRARPGHPRRSDALCLSDGFPNVIRSLLASSDVLLNGRDNPRIKSGDGQTPLWAVRQQLTEAVLAGPRFRGLPFCGFRCGRTGLRAFAVNDLCRGQDLQL